MVITANGEVQTSEEAQVYVHDLDLFVTLQFLEDTLAVLSQGKVREEHGYSYEWASGQKPQLTNNGRRIRCKTENFVQVLPARVQVRLLHCHRRTHLMILRRVQQQHEVTE